MWLIMISLPILALPMTVIGYYTFKKLTYPAYACGSFASLDDTIGWVLRPSTRSCLGARDPLSAGPPWFEATVYTDRNGFRASKPEAETPVGGIMVVGGSYPFGFGLTYEQTFAAQLSAITGIPSVIVSSPGYSSAQAFMLAERWVGRLRPRVIVYLDASIWVRAACRGPHRPTAITKPCYWQPPGAAEAELVVPPPGQVERWARWGMLPGGINGIGETGWGYFLVSRPVYRVLGVLAQLGVVSGFAHDYAAVGVDDEVIRRASLRHLRRLATAAGVPVIFLDQDDEYRAAFTTDPEPGAPMIEHVDAALWKASVTDPAALLPEDQRTVPHDTHFGEGTNHLIAMFLARELRRVGIATGTTN